jgi:hypothetical protein
MNLSRRYFMTTVIGSAATMGSIRSAGLNLPGVRHVREFDCALLDLKSYCVLPESFHGYERALRWGGIDFVKTEPDALSRSRMVIVPGLGLMEPAVAQALSNVANGGACLLLECGAGYLSPSEFFASQEMIQRHFNLAVEPPVDLWSGGFVGDAFVYRPGRYSNVKWAHHGPIPYINYLWPQTIMVRDFSRVIPVSAPAQDVIGRVGELPVALKKRLGKGTLIFLGSPLGPALGAGDPQAMRWLRLCLTQTKSVSKNIVEQDFLTEGRPWDGCRKPAEQG